MPMELLTEAKVKAKREKGEPGKHPDGEGALFASRWPGPGKLDGSVPAEGTNQVDEYRVSIRL